MKNLTKVIYKGKIKGYYKYTPFSVDIYDANMKKYFDVREENIHFPNDVLLFLEYKNTNGNTICKNYVEKNLLK